MRVVFISNFEGSTQNWTGTLSSNALMVGGESLLVSGTTQYTIGNQMTKGRSYILRFIAAGASAGINLTARVESSTGTTTNFAGSASLVNANWQQFELDLQYMDHKPTVDEILYIEGSGGQFFIDDIRLIEVADRFYLIKNSWDTPDSCLEDIFGNYMGFTWNLGCEEYNDREGAIHYLREFSSLCPESAVGCEVMIDTQNYAGYQSRVWQDMVPPPTDCVGDAEDCELVLADTYVYAVYNSRKSCLEADLGCQILGDPFEFGVDVTHEAVYRRNNPNDYDSILCNIETDGCEQFGVEDGFAFFKDPEDEICHWRQETGAGEGGWAWYKEQVSRCDDNGDGIINVSGSTPFDFVPTEPTLCLTNEQCPSPIDCILDINDYACTTYGLKTVGYGGPGNVILQPEPDINSIWWAGVCPADESGCTEFIDPISQFSPNQIYNPTFMDIDGFAGPDGWVAGVQRVDLDQYTMYRLAGVNNTGLITLDCGQPIFIIDTTNRLQSSGLSVSVDASGTDWRSVQFYSGGNNSCTLTVAAMVGDVDIKKLVVGYQLVQDVDKTSCNGQIDFENGCVLFNERSQNGVNVNDLIWDADITIPDDEVPPVSGAAAADNDSNSLVKVRPDRQCTEWLACRSFILDEEEKSVCFDIGLCDSVDKNGSCDNFLPSPLDTQTYNPPFTPISNFSNLTGYNRVGYFPNSEISDLYPLGAMVQEGETLYLMNGNFETFGDNDYPLGWRIKAIRLSRLVRLIR
jgi:hypothetical protein